MATKTRTLRDLYVVGREVILDDGAFEVDPETGETVYLEPVTVYMRKLTPADDELAMRRANAARARVLALRKTPDSDEAMAIESGVLELDRDGLIEYIVNEESAKRRQVVEAELAGDEETEWAKEDYLQGLRDTWEQGMRETWLADPESEEADSVFKELQRFADAVDEVMVGEEEAMRRDFSDTPIEELQERVRKRQFQLRADVAWLDEYRRCEIWLSTRVPEDTNKRYFEERKDVDEVQIEVLARLLREYRLLSVDVTEGKGLPGTRDS